MSSTFALLIGIEDYSLLDHSLDVARGTNDLRGAQNDVHSMAMLVRMMKVPSANIRVLTNPLMRPNDFDAVAMGRNPPQPMDMIGADFRYATSQAILDGLAWLSQQVSAHPEAQGIIYFAGHSILTDAGHPCLCPSDTESGTAAAAIVDPKNPGIVDWYILRTIGLASLARIIGSQDAEQVAMFIAHIAVDPGRWEGRLREGLREIAQDLGVQPAEDALTGFIQTVSNIGDGEEIVEDEATVTRWLHRLTSQPPGPDEVELILHGDPMTGGARYGNLISFNRAFYGALREIPEDRHVHIVLDTCMQGQPHPYYGGIPLAHGGVVLTSSCLPGQASERGVFDNRWHGAFTWAMVSLLSQTPVSIAAEGRSFATTYADFNDNLQDLLRMLGFTQRSGVWAQEVQKQWQVFGTTAGQWQEQEVLAAVRVKEEISAGTTGSIYQVDDFAGNKLGYLIRPKTTYGAWQAGKEYWVWEGAKFPGQFKLTRPAGEEAGFTEWIDRLSPAHGGPGMNAYQSQTFSSGSPPISGYYTVTKKPANEVLCVVQKKVVSGDRKLTWRPVVGCQMANNRLRLMPADQVVLEPGHEIWFEFSTGAPPQSLSLQAKKAEDVFPV